MKVVATRLGYYGLKRRREGDQFVLRAQKQTFVDQKTGKVETKLFTPEQQFSPSWMEKLEDEESSTPGKTSRGRKNAPPAPEAAEEPEADEI
jgi:hypothetical protein